MFGLSSRDRDQNWSCTYLALTGGDKCNYKIKKIAAVSEFRRNRTGCGCGVRVDVDVGFGCGCRLRLDLKLGFMCGFECGCGCRFYDAGEVFIGCVFLGPAVR